MSIQNNQSLIQQLELERNDLNYRLVRLRNFNVSLEFLELTIEEQVLLMEQYRAMQKYYGLLEKRCELHACQQSP